MSQPPDQNVPPPDPSLPPTTPPPASPPPSVQPPYQPAPPPPSQPELTPMPGYGYPPPVGAIPPGMHLDAESGLVLPDGTQLATVGRRIGGYFLDLLLLIVTLVIGYIIWDLILWARGQTPAKQLLRMRCWRPETAKNANWGWMFMRQFIGGLVESIAAVVLLVSFLMMVLSKQHRAIHDYIGGTVVLSDPNNVLAT